MTRRRSTANFGFPRWGGYGRDTDTVHVRMCDRAGCAEAGEHPAPKSPNSRERWHFCAEHAAEYNRNWNFFAGMSEAAAHDYMKSESEYASGFRQSGAFEWTGAADESGYSRTERDALAALDLDTDASIGEIKAQYRRLAKEYHPDRAGGDKEAARRFYEVRTAYDVLKPRLAERV